MFQKALNTTARRFNDAYILTTTNNTDVNKFRDAFIEMFQEKQIWKKQEILEVLTKKGMTVTPAIYSKIMRELAVRTRGGWKAKNGSASGV
jgi:arginine repressor